MAHYAFLNQNNIVIKVIAGKDESQNIDWEIYYTEKVGLVCKRTSYNTYGNIHKLGGIPFRKNFAAIDYKYDETRDAFIPPKPYPSWILNEDTCTWYAPKPRPIDDGFYLWDESNQDWIKR